MSQGAVHGPCEIRHGERPGCATHPTHTKPIRGAAGQSPDLSSDHPFGSAVRDEAVGVLEYSGAGVREVLPPSALPGISPSRGEIGQRPFRHFTLDIEMAET
ncbi:hypothetical protein ATN81_18010 [Agrobacterium pusense]|nr:hypothetical protein [Rhizobium sp. RAS22]OJH53588.1 hypothetical protein ATN81_18010 [Agrobacterium pusense]OJH57908.1 hypothetical protein BA725_19890 [Agrobacterium pusense]CAD7046212.1 hypothetical protein RP007_04959 [Rhizobium sp. P007]